MESEDFWKEVQEHYAWKKKNLIQFIAPDEFYSINYNYKTDISNYKNLSCDELKSIYKKFDCISDIYNTFLFMIFFFKYN